MRHFPKTRRLLLAGPFAIALITGIVGCAGCRGAALLGYVPEDAGLVALVPSLSEAVRNLSQLTNRFSDNMPINLLVQRYKQLLAQELGYDLDRPESVKAKGIDPAQGAVVSTSRDGENIAAVLGVANKGNLEQYLRSLGNKLFGGQATFREQRVEGEVATVLVTQRPMAAWVYRKEHVVLCLRAQGGKVAEYAVQLARQRRSLRDNSLFGEVRGKLGKHEALIYFDGAALRQHMAGAPGRRLLGAAGAGSDSLIAALRGAALGLHTSAQGIVVRGYLAWDAEHAKRVRELLRGKGDAPAFGEFISPDALAVGRFSLDLKQLMDRSLEASSPAAKRHIFGEFDGLERQTKINVERDVLGLLGGRYAFALFPPDGAALLRGRWADWRDPTATNPIAALALIQVLDRKKAAGLLGALERMISQKGVQVRTSTEGEQTVYSIGAPERPLVSWTLLDDVIVVAAGDRLDKAITLRRKGGANVLGQIANPRARKLFKADEGFVFYYSLRKTADAIRGAGLPAELKLMLSSMIPTLAKFVDITWSFDAEEGGALSEIAVRID